MNEKIRELPNRERASVPGIVEDALSQYDPRSLSQLPLEQKAAKFVELERLQDEAIVEAHKVLQEWNETVRGPGRPTPRLSFSNARDLSRALDAVGREYTVWDVRDGIMDDAYRLQRQLNDLEDAKLSTMGLVDEHGNILRGAARGYAELGQVDELAEEYRRIARGPPSPRPENVFSAAPPSGPSRWQRLTGRDRE